MLKICTLLGCSKQQLSYWQVNPYSTSPIYTKTKITVIQKAQKLFSLTSGQAEDLANRAGLTLERPRSFCLSEVLTRFHINYTERMFFYYQNGEHITKESLLALAVSLCLTADESDMLLRRYGFCLSRSMPVDAVVAWFLRCDSRMIGVNPINEVLYELGLPLIGTKEKQRKLAKL